MFSKISALAFISAVSAAVAPTPASCTGTAPAKVCTDFPKYNTATSAPSAATVVAQRGYACIRQNNAYSWPVNRNTATPPIAVVTPSTGTGSAVKAFYGTSVDALGVVAAAAAAVTAATENSGCCVTGVDASCLVGVAASGTSPLAGVLVSRLAKDTSAGDSGFTYNDMHPDFILAATYQGSVATFGAARTAATAWCDPMIVPLATLGTVQDIISGEGLSGQNKCTYIIQAPAAQGAPAFSIKSITTPAAFTFDLHFAEWKGTSDINFVPITSATPNFLGSYATANTYPLPLVASNVYKSDQAQWTPTTAVPGSIG